MDLLYAIRDLGLAVPAADNAADKRARAALAREIERATRPHRSTRWSRALRRGGSGMGVPRGRRRAAAVAAVGVVVACSGVAVAVVVNPDSTVQTASPAELFADNPADWVGGPHGQPNSNTPIVAGSVQQLGTINVPDVGEFQFWAARRTDGEWCAAFRGPDGKWAGTSGETDTPLSERSYAFGGSVPGCGVFGHNARPIHVGGPTFNMQGGSFHFSTDSIAPLVPGSSKEATKGSWIFYGIVDSPGSATSVRDAVGGATAPILAHGTFALVLSTQQAAHVQLQAVNGSGAVISQAYPSGWADPVAPAVKAYWARLVRSAKTYWKAAARDRAAVGTNAHRGP